MCQDVNMITIRKYELPLTSSYVICVEVLSSLNIFLIYYFRMVLSKGVKSIFNSVSFYSEYFSFPWFNFTFLCFSYLVDNEVEGKSYRLYIIVCLLFICLGIFIFCFEWRYCESSFCNWLILTIVGSFGNNSRLSL